MIGRIDKSPQLDIFRVPLKDIIPFNNELTRLSTRIRWDKISEQLSIHYSPDKGRKAIPVRKMAGLLILKKIFSGSDNSILKDWLQNPDFQYFCGEVYYQDKGLINRSDLVSFRKRIGFEGMKKIFYPELLPLLEKMQISQTKKLRKSNSSFNFLKIVRGIFQSKSALKAV